jgi:hypothetical protein
MLQPDLERIGAGLSGNLIEERLVGESVLQAPRRSDPRGLSGVD